MVVTETKLKGCFIIEPKIFEDHRGYFFESFNLEVFQKKTGVQSNFVQDNQSKSSYGVLRGLHFQKGNYAQAKLVRVLSGEVLDVAVDIRTDSPTYGEYISVKLNAENKKQLYVPRGFAHGFVVLSPTCEFYYKCDNYYHPDAESGIIYNDPNLNIDWNIPEKDILLSQKDLKLNSLKKLPLNEYSTV